MAGENLIDAIYRLARAAVVLGAGVAKQTLADMAGIDPDNARGLIVGLHTSLGASNGGTDVDFRTNPDFDLAVHAVRSAVEVGTAENTANNGGSVFNGMHASVQVKDVDRNIRILDGTGAAAGGAGGIDLSLLSPNGSGDEIDLRVPYVFKGQKGSSTMRATFATDSSFPGTRRMGLLFVCSYKRRSFRQYEVA